MLLTLRENDALAEWFPRIAGLSEVEVDADVDDADIQTSKALSDALPKSF